MRRSPLIRPALVAAVVAVAAIVAAGCTTTPPEPDHTTGTVPGGTRVSSPASTIPAGTANPYADQATMAIGLSGDTTNWNVLAAQPTPPSPSGALATVADAVWPSAYVVGPGGTVTRNANLLTSATETSVYPQRIVYRINGRATWSDGTRITGADFVYTWEAQSGQPGFSDVGGKAFTPESTVGYDEIASVSTSAADPDRVVVTFTTPDPDWRSLFSPILPASTASGGGFDDGFTDPVTSLVSGGPFEVQSYQPGVGIVLVRNPRWWGTEANLASVHILFVSSSTEATASMIQGALDATVTGLDAGDLAKLEATPNVTVSVTPTATYDDLVLDERDAPLAQRALRRAILLSVDRTSLVHQAAELGDTHAKPVDNRAFLPDGKGYHDNAGSLGSTSGVLLSPTSRLLRAAGFSFQGAGLAYAGQPVTLTLRVATSSPFTAAETAAVVSACEGLGIALTVVPGGPTTQLAAVRAGNYDLAIVAAQVTPFPSMLSAVYGTGGTANIAGYSSPTMDNLLGRLDTSSGAARRQVADAVDRLVWSDAVDLPLLAQPEVLAYQSRYANLDPGAVGLGSDIGSWGIPERTS